MANNIPLTEGTDAAGGYLVRPEYGTTLLDGIRRESAVQNVVRTERVGTNQRKYAVYAGRPTVGWVDEGAAKPVTGAEFSQLQIDIQKLAATVVYTEELIEDAVEDPTRLIGVDVVGALANEVDAMALGYRNGTKIATGATRKYDATLTDSTQTVDYDGTHGDGAAVAVSDAMELVESNGYHPSGIILGSAWRAALRNARGTDANATMPVYTQGFQREPDTLYGLPIRYSSNLPGPNATEGSSPLPIGIVLDGQQAIMAIRQDITIRVSRDATIHNGGTTYDLFQMNSVAYLWENRTGFNVHDLDKSVAVIELPASAGGARHASTRKS